MTKVIPLVRIENVSFSYENGNQVIKEANVELSRGQIVGLIGPNGAGKTTLVKLLSGLLTPQTGKITFLASSDIKEATVSSPVAVVEQHLSLYEHLPVAHNICICSIASPNLSILSKQSIERDAETVLKDLNIKLPLSEKVSSLSFSQKQLVEIVRSIYQKSPLLILDEPTAALDIESKKILFRVLKRQAQAGYCILLVTHDIADLVGLADTVMTIEDDVIKEIKLEKEIAYSNGKQASNSISKAFDLICRVKLEELSKTFFVGVNAGNVLVWYFTDAL